MSESVCSALRRMRERSSFRKEGWGFTTDTRPKGGMPPFPCGTHGKEKFLSDWMKEIK